MGNKGNVVLYLDKELVSKSKELGFNLSKTFENHLKHLMTQFSTCNSVNNLDSTDKNVSWCGRRDLNPGSQAWKACVLNQLDDDRHSDTIVLETKKVIASTWTMLTMLFADAFKTLPHTLGENSVNNNQNSNLTNRACLRGSPTLRSYTMSWCAFSKI
jgi:hypothetical protein